MSVPNVLTYRGGQLPGYGAMASAPGIVLPAMYQVTEVYEWEGTDGDAKPVNLVARLLASGIMAAQGFAVILCVKAVAVIGPGSNASDYTFILGSDSDNLEFKLQNEGPSYFPSDAGTQIGTSQIPWVVYDGLSGDVHVVPNTAPGVGATTTLTATYYVMIPDQAVVVP